MALQLLISFVYSLIENSWAVSTVLAKYIVFAAVVYAVTQEDHIRGFQRFLENYSRETVTLIVLTGLLTLVAGISPAPYLTVLSHLFAAFYFGYLFWEF